MQYVKKEIGLQELDSGLYRIVFKDEYGIVTQILDDKTLLEALNVVALLATGPDYLFEDTLKVVV